MRCMWIGIATLLLFAPHAGAQSVYKCKTATGTVFSQTPCAADAEQIRVRGTKASAGGQTGSVAAAPAGAASVDLDMTWPNTTTEALTMLGKPQAIYYEEDDEYWLYALGCRASDRKCPELRVVGDKVAQINWHPEATMRRSIAVANGFAGWKPRREDREKAFVVADTQVVGTARAGVAAKLGEPDYKRVFNGIEVWEYRKVRMSATETKSVTLFLEFEGDRVARAIGN